MICLEVAHLPGAACRGVTEPLWDDRVDGETPQQRGERHDLATTICQRCPARAACLTEGLRLRDTAPTIADRPTGIWGGQRLYQDADQTGRDCPVCGAPVYGGQRRRYCSPRCYAIHYSSAYRQRRRRALQEVS